MPNLLIQGIVIPHLGGVFSGHVGVIFVQEKKSRVHEDAIIGQGVVPDIFSNDLKFHFSYILELNLKLTSKLADPVGIHRDIDRVGGSMRYFQIFPFQPHVYRIDTNFQDGKIDMVHLHISRRMLRDPLEVVLSDHSAKKI